MKRRILEMNLARAVEAFRRFSWKFYEVNEDDNLITLEATRGDETLNVILALSDETVNRLEAEGFIKQRVEYS